MKVLTKEEQAQVKAIANRLKASTKEALKRRKQFDKAVESKMTVDFDTQKVRSNLNDYDEALNMALRDIEDLLARDHEKPVSDKTLEKTVKSLKSSNSATALGNE